MEFKSLLGLVLALFALGKLGHCADLGDDCTADSDCSDPDTMACDAVTTTCLIKAGVSCTSADPCVSDATCTDASGTSTCTCNGDVTPSNGRCGPPAGALGGKCLSTGACTSSDHICDAGTCVIKAGVSCTSADPCVSDATCTDAGGTSTCTCNGDVTPSNGRCEQASSQIMDGALGGKCLLKNACTDTVNHICVSDECVIKAGKACNTDDPCVTGATCETDGGISTCTCGAKLMPNSNSGFCEAFVDVGGACTPNLDTCYHKADPSIELTCSSYKCLIKVGKSCKDLTTKCVTGAECKSNFCACSEGYQPQADSTCKKEVKLDGVCSDLDLCTPTTDLVCDPYDKKCVLKVGGNCEGQESKCPAGASCKGNVCTCGEGYDAQAGACSRKVTTVGGTCTSFDKCSSSSSQSLTLGCDPLSSRCLLHVGQNCKGNTDKCVTGAVCKEDQCQCDGVYSTFETACSAEQGKVGGQCESGNSCSDDNAECSINGYCLCKKDYHVKVADASCEQNGGEMASVSVLVLTLTMMLTKLMQHVSL